MAKVKLDYMSLSMRAEGSDDMVRELSGRFLDMADKYAAPGFYFPALPPSVFEDGCRDPEELNTGDMKPLTTPKEVAPGADCDVVAIYDDAGIPSIMHRFRRMSNKELFGGSDKPHPAFIIGGEVYDEIYISVYPNVMINGKPYSLPFQKPAGNITLDDFSKACFSKGEGWHPMTAAEWGFLANLTLNFGGFMLTVFSVDETYSDDNGVTKKYFPADAAMVTAPNCGHMMYGSITQMDYGQVNYSTYAAKRVPKFVVDQDKDTRKLRLGCRPLAAPKNRNPYIFAANVVG